MVVLFCVVYAVCLGCRSVVGFGTCGSDFCCCLFVFVEIVFNPWKTEGLWQMLLLTNRRKRSLLMRKVDLLVGGFVLVLLWYGMCPHVFFDVVVLCVGHTELYRSHRLDLH